MIYQRILQFYFYFFFRSSSVKNHVTIDKVKVFLSVSRLLQETAFLAAKEFFHYHKKQSDKSSSRGSTRECSTIKVIKESASSVGIARYGYTGKDLPLQADGHQTGIIDFPCYSSDLDTRYRVKVVDKNI